MYSNLRTEAGVTNHLLIPRPLELFDYQTDLVTIASSSDPKLAELARKGFPVPFQALRQRVWEAATAGAQGIALVYRRGEREITTSQAELDPELAAEPSFVERKLVGFRPILPMHANRCSH